MPRIEKEANTSFEIAIKKYLDKNADDRLVEKINTGKKTFAGCTSFIMDWARKRATANVAIIADDEVYGQALHFFEEDSIKEPTKEKKAKQEAKVEVPKAESEQKPLAKPAPRPLPKGAVAGQLDIFGLIGGTP